jgi:spore photoproduct lyase
VARIPDPYFAAGTEVELRWSPGVLQEFSATPDGVVCPRFWRLSLGNQCRFGCAYCYLQGTMREMVPRPVLFMAEDRMRALVRKFLARPGSLMLNVGELSDSLDFDDYTGISQWLVPMFGRQRCHRLLMLTKSDNVGQLLGLPHNGMTAVSWSLNCVRAAAMFEGTAPSPRRRILAARRVQDSGYPVRLRIDPMVPLPGWRYEYGRLLEDIRLAGVKPEVITLGSLRFKSSVEPQARRNGRNLEVFSYVSYQGDPDKRARVLEEVRVEMYGFMLRRTAEMFPQAEVGLCKETEKVRRLVGVDGLACNCVASHQGRGCCDVSA